MIAHVEAVVTLCHRETVIIIPSSTKNIKPKVAGMALRLTQGNGIKKTW